jgi:putative tricarboxylic transport membrane protein
MRKHDLISSGVLSCIGLFIVFYSPQFDLGNTSAPGPGFMPFLAGLSILGFSAITCVRAFLNKEDGKERIWVNVRFSKIIFAVSILFIYALLFEKIGFIVCTFFLILFLIRYAGSRTWFVSIVGASLTTFSSYLLFVKWLKTQLPTGIIGF